MIAPKLVVDFPLVYLIEKVTGLVRVGSNPDFYFILKTDNLLLGDSPMCLPHLLLKNAVSL